jgi:hypothetical protein
MRTLLTITLVALSSIIFAQAQDSLIDMCALQKMNGSQIVERFGKPKPRFDKTTTQVVEFVEVKRRQIDYINDTFGVLEIKLVNDTISFIEWYPKTKIACTKQHYDNKDISFLPFNYKACLPTDAKVSWNDNYGAKWVSKSTQTVIGVEFKGFFVDRVRFIKLENDSNP